MANNKWTYNKTYTPEEMTDELKLDKLHVLVETTKFIFDKYFQAIINIEDEEKLNLLTEEYVTILTELGSEIIKAKKDII